MKSWFFILVLALICSIASIIPYVHSDVAYCEGPDEQLAYILPWQYSTALGTIPAGTFNRKVVVLTGGVSKGISKADQAAGVPMRYVLGQAGTLANLLHDEHQAIVFTFSRNPIFDGVHWENHFVGDITDTIQVRAFWNWVKITLATKYHLPTTQIVDYLGLIAGEMAWEYDQDTNWATLLRDMINNFAGNEDVENLARSSDFNMLRPNAVIHHTVSSAAFFPTGQSDGYELAKAVIMKRVRQYVLYGMRTGSGIRTVALFPDAVCGTGIPIGTPSPVVKKEVCSALIVPPRDQRGAFDCYPSYPFTSAEDTARFAMLIWSGFQPKQTFFVIDTPRPVDIDGGYMGKWFNLAHTASPLCYSQAWIEKSANTGKAPVCSVAFGPRKFLGF